MAVAIGMFAQSVLADIPGTINYQGRLTDAAGNAVADGTYGVTFTLYYEATGDTPTGWSEVQNISTRQGYFNIALGSQTSLSSLSFDVPYYLETWVSGDPQPMSPRQLLQSVPYAMRAQTAVQADSVADGSITSSKIVDGTITRSKIAMGADIPVGSILAWHQNFSGMPPLQENFMQCNGQVINDAESP
jgi:hypothetical protein